MYSERSPKRTLQIQRGLPFVLCPNIVEEEIVHLPKYATANIIPFRLLFVKDVGIGNFRQCIRLEKISIALQDWVWVWEFLCCRIFSTRSRVNKISLGTNHSPALLLLILRSHSFAFPAHIVTQRASSVHNPLHWVFRPGRDLTHIRRTSWFCCLRPFLCSSSSSALAGWLAGCLPASNTTLLIPPLLYPPSPPPTRFQFTKHTKRALWLENLHFFPSNLCKKGLKSDMGRLTWSGHHVFILDVLSYPLCHLRVERIRFDYRISAFACLISPSSSLVVVSTAISINQSVVVLGRRLLRLEGKD